MKALAAAYATQIKQRHREMTIFKHRLFESVALLPGEQCACIEFYLDEGVLNHSTRMVVIEHSAAVMDRIKRRFAKRYKFSEVIFYKGSLHTTPHYFAYDFVNLDTCTGLSLPLLQWLSLQQFVEGAEINVWLTAFRGNSGFYHNLVREYLSDNVVPIQEISRNATEPLNFAKLQVAQIVTAAALYSSINYACKVRPPLKYIQHISPIFLYRFVNLQSKHVGKIPQIDCTTAPRHDEEEHQPQQLPPVSDLLHSQMCVAAVQSATIGQRSYIKRVLRLAIQDGVLRGYNPALVKAGWKAAISRKASDRQWKGRAHEFIDSL